MPGNGRHPISKRDWGLGATSHDLSAVMEILTRLAARDGRDQFRRLVDVGCGYGGLTVLVARQLDVEEVHGVDRDPEHLADAEQRGVTTSIVDLDHDPLPFEDGSIDICTSFGVMEYLVLYDNVLSEVSRVLAPGGWFVMSMPNLGSYTNRLALLLGRQPREVEVSAERYAGMLSRYRGGAKTSGISPHLHAATLRCMRELLDFYDLEVVEARGLSPRQQSRTGRMADSVLGRFPSIARRFILLGQRR